MGKSLVIVESPAKAKTINKYLGNNFIVKSSVGHIRDLPTSQSNKKSTIDPKERAKLAAASRKLPPKEREQQKRERADKALIQRMGIDPHNHWQARYEIVPGKEKVIKELQQLATNADCIYLATDLDREGEAIAWHLRETIGGNNSFYKRVVFNEITKKSIQDAFTHPQTLNIDYVNAQQTRRFLDRVVGYMVSPLLWKKLARGLSAGRVQSVAVRLLVEREREIYTFQPEEYWEVHCQLHTQNKEPLLAQVVKQNNKSFRPDNQEQTHQAVTQLQQANYRVSRCETKTTTSKPRAPFITSTLQQAASTRLAFGVKKTMMLAQRLYEAGFITYMRTDSTNLSQDAITTCREYIDTQFGSTYLPDKARHYSSKKNAQEAHEAIRPSNVYLESSMIKGVDHDAQRLYALIRCQFIACQMADAKFDNTTLKIVTENSKDVFELRCKGRIIRFDGWMKVLKPQSDDNIILPQVQENDPLALEKVQPSQHFTKPPPRYTEASLVKELEKKGIGRPSTYASIISTIQERGYVRVEKRRFYAQKIGEVVTERLIENFSDLMSYDFTAKMEEKLDNIAQGNAYWIDTLDNFYHDFKKKLDKAEDDKHGMRPNTPVATDIDCPSCGRKMMIRVGSTGVFLGCQGYNLKPSERCKTTINLIAGEEVVNIDEDDEGEAKALIERHRCPQCESAMDSYLMDEKRKLHICGNSPDCSGYELEQGNFRIKGYDGPVIECNKCGADMQLKTGRFGKYFACSNSACKNTRKLLRNGEVAPPKAEPVAMPELACSKSDAYFVLRDGAAGIFLAAHNFPKSRETRAPLVKELLPHCHELDEKHRYLCDAPVEDDAGNPSIIRYSRKNKEQYVMTEVEGKATGWKAFFQNHQWIIEVKPQKVTKKKASSKKTTTKKATKKKSTEKKSTKKAVSKKKSVS